MAETRLKDMYDCLKKAGFSVYFPTQKTGECSSPYVVIRDAGTVQYQDFSTVFTTYELLCYVPKNQYSQLEVFSRQVKRAMKSLWPMIVPTRYQTPPFFDDTVNAHMTAIQYRNAKYEPIGGM